MKYDYYDFDKDLYIYGFSKWGYYLMKNFFKPKRVFFVKNVNDLENINENSVLIMYPTYRNEEIISYCNTKNIKVAFVEDGFIRSLTLGSSFFKPASIVVDYRGIYYDPTRESDLEYFCNTYNCSNEDINRASNLKDMIIDMQITKYNHLKYKKLDVNNSISQKVLLVVGQVDDDMSIKTAGFGLDSFKLLKKVREENKNEYIIYKPHPDVVFKIREGLLDIKKLKQFADLVVIDANLDSCFEVCDEVHTISSLSGFEALLRNKKVIVYGAPFYSNWGLTEDKIKINRRKKQLSLEELLFIAYIKYPRYISLINNNFCEVEQVIEEIVFLREKYFKSVLFRTKINLMGKLGVTLRKIYGLLK